MKQNIDYLVLIISDILHTDMCIKQKPGMRLFRFLADFRYFQGKFHHFCESSKSGLKFFFGGGRGSGDGL